MAALTATSINKFYIGNQKIVTGRVASLTSSGGHVAAAALGLRTITEVLGVVGEHSTPSVKNGVRNSQNGTADTSDGDLYLDAGSTQNVHFAVMGR